VGPARRSPTARVQLPERSLFSLRPRHEGGDVLLSIGDTGTGIPEAIRPKIFDPFFTTKEVGRGTGQALAIARSIVGKHRGSIRFDTEVGRGTTFHIRLPVESTQPAAAAATAS
jgi:signal transduction histidine kinase